MEPSPMANGWLSTAPRPAHRAQPPGNTEGGLHATQAFQFLHSAEARHARAGRLGRTSSRAELSPYNGGGQDERQPGSAPSRGLPL